MSRFTKVDVPGDGSCYFHAITGFLEMEKLVKGKKTYYKQGNASDLRKRVVNWLRNNLNFQYENGLTIQDDIVDDIRNNPNLNSAADYLQHMSKESAYAGQIEITATSNLLKRNIRVYILDKGKYKNVGFGYEINPKKKNDITLFHNMTRGVSKGNHFEILFPTNKARVISESMYDKLKSKVNHKMVHSRSVSRSRQRVKRSRVRRNKMRTKKMRTKQMRTKQMKRKQPKKKKSRRGKRTRRK